MDVAIYPGADTTNDWTPSTGTTAWECIDEEPVSDADYVSTGAVGDVCRVVLDTASSPTYGVLARITSVVISMRVSGVDISTYPVHKVRLYLNGTAIYEKAGVVDTGAGTTFSNRALTITGLNIDPLSWDNGSPEVEIETYYYAAGKYEDIPTEV